MQAAGKSAAAVQALRQGVELGEDLRHHRRYQDAALALSAGQEPPRAETVAMRRFYEGRDDDGASPLTPYLQARLLRLDGRWEPARVRLEECLRRAPGYHEAQYELGLLWRGVGKFAKSAEWLRQASKSAPGRAPAQLALAQVAGELGHWAEAAKGYQRYLEIVPGDRKAQRAHLTLLLYQVDGDRDEMDRLVKALWQPYAKGGPSAANPDLDLQMDLAAVHWKRGRSEQALAEYRAVIRRDPKRARAALNLGNLFFELGLAKPKGHRQRRFSLGQARKAYRYFRGLGKTADAFDWFDLELAVRMRLQTIAAELGKPDSRPVTWQDL